MHLVIPFLKVRNLQIGKLGKGVWRNMIEIHLIHFLQLEYGTNILKKRNGHSSNVWIVCRDRVGKLLERDGRGIAELPSTSAF